MKNIDILKKARELFQIELAKAIKDKKTLSDEEKQNIFKKIITNIKNRNI